MESDELVAGVRVKRSSAGCVLLTVRRRILRFVPLERVNSSQGCMPFEFLQSSTTLLTAMGGAPPSKCRQPHQIGEGHVVLRRGG